MTHKNLTSEQMGLVMDETTNNLKKALLHSVAQFDDFGGQANNHVMKSVLLSTLFFALKSMLMTTEDRNAFKSLLIKLVDDISSSDPDVLEAFAEMEAEEGEA
jgi:hypothetical protein